MDDGRVVDSIPRAELFARPSVFLDLWNQQQALQGSGMEIQGFPAPAGEPRIGEGDGANERRA
jgi:hypothetical protein